MQKSVAPVTVRVGELAKFFSCSVKLSFEKQQQNVHGARILNLNGHDL